LIPKVTFVAAGEDASSGRGSTETGGAARSGNAAAVAGGAEGSVPNVRKALARTLRTQANAREAAEGVMSLSPDGDYIDSVSPDYNRY
jgi:hypothetical protein